MTEQNSPNPKPVAGKDSVPEATIVIATDFTESSQQATLHGFRTASTWGAAPHVVHVCQQISDGLSIKYGDTKLLLTPDKGRLLLAEHVDNMIKRYRSLYGELGFGVAVSHLLVGDPAEAIVSLAADLRAGLVVVGNSANEGVQRLLLGSTAEKVVRSASCAVLVSRPRDKKADEMIEPACPACVTVRQQSGGERIWCDQHLAVQERRHTYHYRDKNARVRENMPLLFPMSG